MERGNIFYTTYDRLFTIVLGGLCERNWKGQVEKVAVEVTVVLSRRTRDQLTGDTEKFYGLLKREGG